MHSDLSKPYFSSFCKSLRPHAVRLGGYGGEVLAHKPSGARTNLDKQPSDVFSRTSYVG